MFQKHNVCLNSSLLGLSVVTAKKNFGIFFLKLNCNYQISFSDTNFEFSIADFIPNVQE